MCQVSENLSVEHTIGTWEEGMSIMKLPPLGKPLMDMSGGSFLNF